MSEPVRRAVVRLSRDRRAGEIEAAAREVFCERGFEAASTAEIAARAQVAEGTLYKYFQNKRALLIQVLETWYQSMMADYQSHLAVIQGSRNKVHYIVSRHLRSLKDNADLARLSYNEVRHSGDYYESRLYEFNREYTQVFVEACREGIRNGEIRADVPVGLLRDLIFGGIDHLISGYLFNQRPLDIESSAAQLVALVFDGIVVTPPTSQATDKALQRFELLAERMEATLGNAAKPPKRPAKPRPKSANTDKTNDG